MKPMFWKTHLQQDPRLNRLYYHIKGRPGWVWTAALIAAIFVVVLPLLLLSLAAFIVAAAVFALLSLVLGGVRFIGGLFDRGRASLRRPSTLTPDDGRRNVRVIDRS